MTPTRKRRLAVAMLILLAAGVAGTLTVYALQSNITYLHTPSEVDAGTAPGGTFRLGGLVTENSMRREPGSLEVRFTVTDRVHTVPVRYSGILPDLFREGQSIIARGALVDGEFMAEEILAKHDETYMPEEVKKAMEEAKSEGRAAPHGPQGGAMPAAGQPPSGGPPSTSDPGGTQSALETKADNAPPPASGGND